jgi:hypothetical protein
MTSYRSTLSAFILLMALTFSSCAEQFVERGGSPKIFYSHHSSKKPKEVKFLGDPKNTKLQYDTFRYGQNLFTVPIDTLIEANPTIPKAQIAQVIKSRRLLKETIKTVYRSKATLNSLGAKQTLRNSKSQNSQTSFSDQTLLFQYSIWGLLGSVILVLIGAGLYDVLAAGEGILMFGLILLYVCFFLFILSLVDKLLSWIFYGWSDMHWLWRLFIPLIAITSLLFLFALAAFSGF